VFGNRIDNGFERFLVRKRLVVFSGECRVFGPEPGDLRLQSPDVFGLWAASISADR
jgi:hypothetical protein